MSLQIIVEDGTGVANANSYIDVATLVAYAALRGVTIAADDSAAVCLIQAMDYLESLDYIGDQTLDPPNLQWPRTYTEDDFENPSVIGWDYPFGPIFSDTEQDTPPFQPNEIPTRLKNAQCQLAMAVNSGMQLAPNTNGQYVIMEKVGPLETRYSEKIASTSPGFPIVDAMLAPLVTDTSSSMSVIVDRA